MGQDPWDAPCLFLTGPPGCGKTTLVREALRRSGVTAGGFYTEEVRQGSQRVGFNLVTLNGGRVPLAWIGMQSPYRVGRYGVDLAAVDEVGVPALKEALAAGRLAVVDEVGKMELFSPAFREAVRGAVEAGRPVLGAVMLRPHPWADELKTHTKVGVVNVSRDRYEDLVQRVLQWLARIATRAVR